MYKGVYVATTISLIMGTLGVVVDGMIIARCLGSEAMAAYGISIPIMPIIIMIGGVLTSGSQILCGKYMADGDAKGARGVFSLSIALGIIISIIFTLLVMLGSSPLTILLGASGNAQHLFYDARSYIIGMSVSFIFAVISFVVTPYLQFEGDRKRIVIGVVLSVVVNVIADLVNVFAFKGSLFGMGIATAISYVVYMIVLLAHFLKKDSIFKFRPREIHWKETKSLISRGVPMAVNRLSYCLKIVILNHITLAVSGTAALTALSIQNNLYNFFGAIALGTGQTMLLVASVLAGERNRESMRFLLKNSIKVGTIIGGVVAAILFIFAPVFAGIYAHGDAEVISLASVCLRFFALSLVLFVFAMAYINFLLGTGRFKLAIIYIILDIFALPVVSAVIFGNIFGITGVWASFLIGRVLTMVAFFVIGAVINKRLPKNMDDYMMLSADYDVPQERQCEWSVSEESEAIKASSEAYEFLKSKGLPGRTTYITSLCIEEMAKNTLEHGKKEKEELCVYLRVVETQNGVVIRMRDNGEVFNPMTWLKLHGDNDKASNIGIRMTIGMAKDFRYMNTMGMNSIIIHI